MIQNDFNRREIIKSANWISGENKLIFRDGSACVFTCKKKTIKKVDVKIDRHASLAIENLNASSISPTSACIRFTLVIDKSS